MTTQKTITVTVPFKGTEEDRRQITEALRSHAVKVVDATSLISLNTWTGRSKNWLSIEHKSNCLFARRNGNIGKIIFGYSICLRLFGKDIL